MAPALEPRRFRGQDPRARAEAGLSPVGGEEGWRDREGHPRRPFAGVVPERGLDARKEVDQVVAGGDVVAPGIEEIDLVPLRLELAPERQEDTLAAARVLERQGIGREKQTHDLT